MNKVIFILFAAMAFSLTGCIPSFRMNGTAINYDIYKTIDISEFPIRAALVYPPLQQTFENRLLDYVTRQTRLQEVDAIRRILNSQERLRDIPSPRRLSAPMHMQPKQDLQSLSELNIPTTRIRQTILTRLSRHTGSSPLLSCSLTCRMTSATRSARNS